MVGFVNSVRGRLLLTLLAALLPSGLVFYHSRLKVREKLAEDASLQLLSFASYLSQREQQLSETVRQILSIVAEVHRPEGHDRKICSALYQRLLAQPSPFRNLGATDGKGTVFCSAQSGKAKASVAMVGWFERTIRSGDFNKSNLCKDPITGLPSLCFAYPIKPSSGAVKGVVYAAIDPRWLLKDLDPGRLPKELAVTVADATGQVVVRLSQNGVSVGGSVKDDPGLARLVHSQVSKGTWRLGQERERRIYAMAPFGLGRVVVFLPEIAITREQDQILNRHFFALLLAGFASLIGAWLGSTWSITGSLKPLLQATTQLREGDLSVRVGTVALNEFQKLGDAFDAMAERLEARNRLAEERLRRLTGLHQLETDLSRCRSLQDLTEVVARHLTKLYHCPYASVCIVDPSRFPSGILTVASLSGLTHTVSCIYRALGTWVFEEIPSLDRSLPFPSTKPYLRVPVRENGKEVGNVTIFQPEGEGRIPSEEEEAFLETIGQHLAIARERIGLFQRLTRQVRWTESLIRVVRTAHMRLNVHEIAQIATEELTSLMPGTALALVMEEGPEREPIVLAHNEDARPMVEEANTPEESLRINRWWWEMRSGSHSQISLRNQVADWESPLASLLLRHGWTSFLKVDISFGEEILGALVAAKRDAVGFTAEDCEYARSVCNHLAVAFRNAGLFHQLVRAYEDLKAAQAALIQQERLHALGQMASGVAHDIRNALVPLVASVELLESHPDEQVQQIARSLQRTADDIVHIITRLQVFYKKKVHQEEMEPLNLNELVEQAVDLTRPRWFDSANREGVTIEVRCDLRKDLPITAGIGAEIREALINVIFNAVDAIVAKGASVGSLGVRTGLRDGYVYVEIRDSGVGMNEETLRRCREPFYTTKGERGTGLGLTMVASVVDRHEGLLELESDLGVGTTVRLLLPVRSFGQSGVPSEGEAPVPSHRILLVDDDPRVRDSLARTLLQLGQTVVTASTGPEAIAQFRQGLESGNPFTLVLTDLGMPHMSGEELIRRLRNLSPSTPIVAMSGWTSETTPIGADLLLPKPASARDLRRALLTLSRTAALQQ